MKHFILLFFSLLLLNSLAFGYAGGPPDNRAGNPPGNQTCIQCHSSFALNSGDGSFELSGLPDDGTYVPGQTYPLVLTLNDNGQTRWGFEITSLFGDNTQAGEFVLSDAVNTQLSDNNGDSPDFLKQTNSGTAVNTWNFNWVAPMEMEDITFYFSGNAANNNFSTSGDYIYAFNQMISPGQAADISVNPLMLDFGQVVPGQTTQLEVTVSSTGNMDLIVDEIIVPDGYMVNPDQFTLVPEAEQVVTVTFSPEEEMQYNGIMIINSNSPNAVEVQLSGEGFAALLPQIEIAEDMHDFGNVEIGQTSTWQIMISNIGNGDLVIENVNSSDNAFSVDPLNLTIAAGQMDSIEVVFMPVAEGDQESEITMTTNDPDNAMVMIDCSGFGLANNVYENKNGIPGEFTVGSSYPNPFNPSTTIPFSLPQSGQVKISIFNVMGQILHQSSEYYNAGNQQFTFDVSVSDFQSGSGIYFANIQFQGVIHTQKLMLIE